MKKMYNDVVELLPEMIHCFNNHSMFDILEEGDIISFIPFEDEAIAKDFVAQTNQMLADYFEVDDELCYSEDSYLDNHDNPVFFWKDYLNCFFTLELVGDEMSNEGFEGTSYGMYKISERADINEVNKRLKQRRINGLRLEYKVKSTPMDRNKHWNRTYDKDF